MRLPTARYYVDRRATIIVNVPLQSMAQKSGAPSHVRRAQCTTQARWEPSPASGEPGRDERQAGSYMGAIQFRQVQSTGLECQSFDFPERTQKIN